MVASSFPVFPFEIFAEIVSHVSLDIDSGEATLRSLALVDATMGVLSQKHIFANPTITYALVLGKLEGENQYKDDSYSPSGQVIQVTRDKVFLLDHTEGTASGPKFNALLCRSPHISAYVRTLRILPINRKYVTVQTYRVSLEEILPALKNLGKLSFPYRRPRNIMRWKGLVTHSQRLIGRVMKQLPASVSDLDISEIESFPISMVSECVNLKKLSFSTLDHRAGQPLDKSLLLVKYPTGIQLSDARTGSICPSDLDLFDFSALRRLCQGYESDQWRSLSDVQNIAKALEMRVDSLESLEISITPSFRARPYDPLYNIYLEEISRCISSGHHSQLRNVTISALLEECTSAYTPTGQLSKLLHTLFVSDSCPVKSITFHIAVVPYRETATLSPIIESVKHVVRVAGGRRVCFIVRETLNYGSHVEYLGRTLAQGQLDGFK